MSYENTNENTGVIGGMDAAALSDYSQMKEKLSMEVVSADRNADMLDQIPHERMEDLAVVYKIVIADTEDHRDTVLVTNDMLDQFGVTAEQMKVDALENAPVLRPAELAGLTETIAKMSGLDAEDLLQGEPETTFVAAARGDQRGAGVIAYPNFLEQAAEKLGGDFFILPSSVHEILLVKDDSRMSGQDLQQMVGDINAAEVLPEDQLTDHAYHYDSKAHIFELVETFEARQAVKENGHGLDDAGRSGEKESVLEGLKDRKADIEKKDAVKSSIEKAGKLKGGEAI